MDQITTQQFRLLTRENPRWADTLTEPVAIIHYCNMAGEPIQRLSRFLHFIGTENYGHAASFENCEELENAAGVFHGYVAFDDSAITTSLELDVITPSRDGGAACFKDCQKLEKAEGRFNGGVTWDGANIQSIGKLEILKPDNEGWAANFEACFRLKLLTGKFPGAIDARQAGIEIVKNLRIEQTIKTHLGIVVDLRGCPLKRAPQEMLAAPKTHPMDADVRQRVATLLDNEKKARRQLKQPAIEL